MDVGRLLEFKEVYSFPLILIGGILTHMYLYTVDFHLLPISLLFFGVFLQSIGITMLLLPLLMGSRKKINTVLFLTCVLALSFSVNYMRVSRFDMVMGGDTPKEVNGAKIVRLAGSWDPYFATPGLTPPSYKYAGSLAITIFPLIACELIGLSVENFFRFLMSMIVGLHPLYVFIMLRYIFKESPITYLTTALWPQLFFNHQLLEMTRSGVGLPLLWLIIYILFRKPIRSHLLLVILAFGAVSAHYTVSYFGFYILLFIAMLRPLCEFLPILGRVIPKPQKVVERSFILAYSVVTLSWLAYCVARLFTWHLQQAQSLLESLLSLNFSGKIMRWEQGFIFESPRGPIITAWFDMQFLLMGLGGLIALVDCIRRRVTSSAQVIWVLLGSSMIGVLVSTMLPYISLYVEAGRLICYFSPFLCSFMAIVLLRLRGRSRPLAVFFLLSMLTMNLLLPAHQNDIMYNSDKELSPERMLIYRSTKVVTLAGEAVGEWIEQCRPVAEERIDMPIEYGRKEPIITDHVGFWALMLTPISIQDVFVTSRPCFSFRTPMGKELRYRYMLISSLYTKYGLWSYPIPSEPVGTLKGAQRTGAYSTQPLFTITAQILFQDHLLNLAYDNGEFKVIRREGELANYRDWELG